MRISAAGDITSRPESRSHEEVESENRDLWARLDEARETLRALYAGEVDAFVVRGTGGEQLFTLKGADRAYRLLIEEMSEGALTLTADGVIVYANRRFAEMMRRSAAEERRGQLELTAADGTIVPIFRVLEE